MKKPTFSLRSEYREYVNDCMDACESPWTFRDWFEVCYHYEMADEMPSGEPFDGSFANYAPACLN